MMHTDSVLTDTAGRGDAAGRGSRAGGVGGEEPRASGLDPSGIGAGDRRRFHQIL